MKKKVFRTLLAMSVSSVALASSAWAASIGSSSAFGESVVLKILPALGSPIQIGSGPLPSVSGTAAPPYSSSSQVASANVSAGLLVSAGLHTGLLIVNAASDVPNSDSASADSTVNNTGATVGALVGLTADVIQSKANSGGSCGALSSTGTTTLANVKLNGITVDASPAPNTVLLNALGVKIVLNEQLGSGNGSTDTGLTVNAIHISLNNAVLGLGLISGDIIIAQSKSSLHCTLASSDLMLTKTSSERAVHNESIFVYHLITTNLGPSPATGVVLTDALPAGVRFMQATASQGSCTGTTTLTCTLPSLASGASWPVDVMVRVVGTNATNTASVTANEDDPNPSNNTATAVVTVN